MSTTMAPVDGAGHRRLMAAWTTGVSLVTTIADGAPYGCTLNALTSLSLDPPSLVVCLGEETRTLSALRQTGRFCVNVLAADQQHVSALFADRSLTPAQRFAAVPHRMSHGIPVIEGCVATVVCDLMEERALCDHVLVVGRVLHGGVADDAEPLVFFGGGYRRAV
jgi:3-hydroxy-9,10-secoandrosta-1,3,5(10)-triene-9,17-dione monooxygenase reductase component